MQNNIDELSNSVQQLANYSLYVKETFNKEVEDKIQTYETSSRPHRYNTLKDTIQAQIKCFTKEGFKPFCVAVFLVFFLFRIVANLSTFFYSIYNVDISKISFDATLLFWMLIPFLVFTISTNFDICNFYKIKLTFISLCIFNFILELLKILFIFIYGIFIPLILKMPIVRGITASMLLSLCRLALFAPFLIFLISIGNHFLGIIFNRYTKIEILNFKLGNILDKNLYNPYAYNIKIIQYMSSGRKYIMKEKDRFLHVFLNGTTGSGKTSSYLIKQIVSDLNTRLKNSVTLKTGLLKLIKKKKIYIIKEMEDKNFSPSAFRAFPGYEKKLDKLLQKYRMYGQTIIAPNDELTDNVYNFCKNRGIPCNRLDPILDEETKQPKEGFIGFNPLLLSSNISSDSELQIDIIKKATLFADVLQFLNEMNGKKSDPYFSGVNRSLTTATVILLELTYSTLHPGMFPTPEDVQLLINNFQRFKPYYEAFKQHKLRNHFKFIEDFIANDVLGAGFAKLTEQSNGLRNTLNELLTHPLVRNLLCTQNSIDMDRILKDGEITVFNFALCLGDSISSALGLLFSLSFNDAVLRRPGTEKTRLPHFLSIDEFPIIVHPSHEKCFSLFRQYRVGVTVAAQSFTQMDKTDITKYLKDVLLTNCAHQIIYGRCGTAEMKMYSELAGKEYRVVERDTVSQTSLTDTDPTYSYSVSSTLQQENLIDEADIRNKGFQEVTVFAVRNGCLKKPFAGKLSFLKEIEYFSKIKFIVNWSDYYDATVLDKKEGNKEKESTSLNEILKDKVFFTSQGAITEIENLLEKEGNISSYIQVNNSSEDAPKEIQSTDNQEDNNLETGSVWLD